MKYLKRIHPGVDASLFAINGIVIPLAFFYMGVTVHDQERGDKEIKIGVRMNPHVHTEAQLPGVDYRTFIPVLACDPSDDEGFHTELGYIDIKSRCVALHHQKRTYLAYLGSLPDVAESDMRDKRYVCPIDIRQVPSPVTMPQRFRNVPRYGATIRTDYLRTSALDQIDDETWEALLTIDHAKGTTWSQFLDAATSGRFTPHDDLSDCLESIDQEYMPEHIFKRIRIAQFEKRRN
ncbi:hypothetical protein MPK64_gp310 [Erwinia phage pEa_SNUABM_16]|uniref:Uncharacterized protein n=1 Tax=Erwinia phage pEa_SNUABM_16 TaxID=2869544 RepID=A0AAE8XR48_9CAUD|nr:hypothetical protein MPK64_gp310 [Erwinia phage pEa_SNUABM_16]UAW96454.1 hypothetical protein pEaSNUABM16_00310 [Erwinia phage pEa_SNUABM_16]